ncbi:MAG: DUF6777 domain-containing protein [Acidimicrobiales bacterium]|nr:DUF6777 domain-containing protein [Acidimicrobiales bacterium]
MSTPTTSLRATRVGFIVVLFLLLTACRPGTADDTQPASVETDEITLTSRDTAQRQPRPRFVTTQIHFAAAETRGDDPFVADAEIVECHPEDLIAFLADSPAIAAAWADASGVEVERIAETIRSWEPTVLTVDTRVTNHAYRSGTARGFQATLEAGTAVLVDDAGVPRVRCACGNPLLPPQPVGEETPEETPTQVPVTTTTTVPTPTVPTQRPTDFCTTWDAVRPSMVGGPSAPGPEAMTEYFHRLVDGFDQLIAAATATPGFPADALTDLTNYRNAIAAADPASPGPGPEDALLGARVEDFVTDYCGDEDAADTADADDTVEADDTVDAEDIDEPTPTDGSSGNCGSMQFALLIMLAEDLGIDHAATSQPYIDAMNALVNGFDPGPEFDVSDLSIMLANEEIGCQGAQAMQALVIAHGYGPLIDGTELGA